MTDSLDPSQYVRVPRLDVASTLSLGKMLLAVVPKAGPLSVKHAAKELHRNITALETAWRGAAVPQRVADARGIDRRLDNLWSTTNERLSHFEVFGDAHPKCSRARAARGVLFPDGTAFLKLSYVQEHAESQKRLDLIAEHKLDRDLDDLVGAEFLSALRETHAAYGRALGITTAPPPPPDRTASNVSEPLRAAARAITGYALQLLAHAGSDERNTAAVSRALAPIDKFREANRRGAAGPADEPPPDAPTPPPPADPADGA